ncbi:MAG: helix-turn-helix domain-containing protein, partial [Sneathiella sp.]|nr:helix-turn-helix domain-containing protein [Sneathiella sp.]
MGTNYKAKVPNAGKVEINMNPKLSLLSEVIRRRMYDLNIRTIKALEDEADVPRDTIRNVLSGRTKTIRANKLGPIADALKIEISELIGTGAPTISHQSGDYTMVPR